MSYGHCCDIISEKYNQVKMDYDKAQIKLGLLWFELEKVVRQMKEKERIEKAMNDYTGKNVYEYVTNMVKIMGEE